MIKKIIILALIGGGIYYYWTTRSVSHGPGIIAPQTPKIQTIYDVDNIDYKGFKITPKDKIHLEARVLSKKTYYFDKYSDLVPTDIVFGWAEMSDETNLNKILIRQENRGFNIEMTKPPIKQQKMDAQSDNMHLIGSTQEIRDKISSIREGQIVIIKGYLVNAKSPDGWTLYTSRSLTERGNNTSELVWINTMSVL